MFADYTIHIIITDYSGAKPGMTNVSQYQVNEHQKN